MTTILMPEGQQRYFNNDGTVAAGCKLYTYAAGTSNPKVAYTDAAGLVPHQNPITLDAKGEALIFWDGAYKVDLLTAAGAQITGYPVDNVNTDPANVWTLAARLLANTGAGLVGYSDVVVYAAGTVGKKLQDFATSVGSGLVGYILTAVNAVARTVSNKLDERVSVFDFMTAAQRADVRAGTALLDVTAAVQAAIDHQHTVRLEQSESSTYRTISAPRLFFPYGRYRVTGLTIYDEFDAYGERSVIYGSDPAIDIITGAILRIAVLEGVSFVGGKSALNWGNGNYDATRYVVKKCEFHGGAYYPIVATVAGGVYTHLSATWLIEDCRFMRTYGFAINRCDYMIFNRCDLYADRGNFAANMAAFKNMASDGNCRLYIIDCTGVPTMGTYGVDRPLNVRWIDHLGGDVMCTRFRAGGEGAGMPVIYFDAPPLTTGVPGPQISLIDCELNSGPNAAPDSGVIYLVSQVPQSLTIRGSKGPQSVPLVSDASGGVNWATYFPAWETATGALALKYYNYFKLDIAMVEQVSPDFITDRIPVQMDPLTRSKRTTIRNSAILALPAATTAITLGGTPDFDNLGAWVVATPTRVALVNRARRGYISGSIILDAGIAQGVLALRITNSSGIEIAGQTVRVDLAGGTGGALTELSVSCPVYSTVDTDYFEMKLFCTSVGGCTAQVGKAILSITQEDPVG